MDSNKQDAVYFLNLAVQYSPSLVMIRSMPIVGTQSCAAIVRLSRRSRVSEVASFPGRRAATITLIVSTLTDIVEHQWF